MSNLIEPELSPDAALLSVYIRRAMPTCDDAQNMVKSPGVKLALKQARERVERERSEATQALVQLYREGRSNGNVAPELKAFANRLMDGVLRSPDPLAELSRLLNGKARRGATPKAKYRDFIAAAEVAERVQTGIPRKVAIAEVAEKFRLTLDVVRNAYAKRDKQEVKIELARRGYEALASRK